MQVFLQAKIVGISEFLLARLAGDSSEGFLGCSQWVSLLSEVLPRALLEELGLSSVLLGSSGGGQILLVLPEESKPAAEQFLAAAAADMEHRSSGFLRLVWSFTENLGDWSDIRKRLADQLAARSATPLSSGVLSLISVPDAQYFESLGRKLRQATSIGWSSETPALLQLEGGKRAWPLGNASNALPFGRHAALDDANENPAPPHELAPRGDGYPAWGVLRGDVDLAGIRLRKTQSIDEYIRLSVMYKQFLAGELELLCAQPEYWRKVSLIYTGGDDFAVYGTWDALLSVAREMQRVFSRFAQHNLAEFAGPEGKTISMAIALAPSDTTSLGAVFEDCGARLEAAKAADKDCIWVLGRILEWKQLAEASDLKDQLLKMIRVHGCSPQYLRDLCGMYRESPLRASRRQLRREGERPWRYHRRIRRILAASRPNPRPARGEYREARAALIANLIGRSALAVKLRPAGRVALEWARLLADA